MPVRSITSEAEWQATLAQGKTVIVYVTATWCGPARIIGPRFHELSDYTRYQNLVFVSLDLDDNRDIVSREGLARRGAPAFAVFEGGENVEEFTGADRDRLEAMLDRRVG